MSVILDYTSRIAPADLRAAGAIGVNRYLSYNQPNTAWKRITQPEYDELAAEFGHDFVTLNWEYDARDWLGGLNAGHVHGSLAARQAAALGYPAGHVIIGSADFDMTLTEWTNAGRAYSAAFATTVHDAGYRSGVYGPWDVLTWVYGAGYMDAFWQAGMSWTYSGGRNAKPWPGAHLRQRGHLNVAGHDTDYSDILIPHWGRPKDDDVKYLVNVKRDNGQNFVCTADGVGNWHWIAGPDPIGGQALAFWQSQGLVSGGDLTEAEGKARFGIDLTTLDHPAGGVTVNVTQEQMTTAVADNANAIGAAVATHLKVV